MCLSYAFVEHYRGCHLADSLYTLLCVSPMSLSSIIEGAIWQTLFIHCCVSLLCLCRALSRVPFGRLSLYTVVCLSYVFVEHYRGCHLADSLCTLLCVSPMPLSSIIEGAIWLTLFIHCCVSLLCLCRALSRVPFGRLSLYTVVCLSYVFVEHYRGCHLADSLYTLLCVSPMPLSSIIEGAIWQTLFIHCCVSLLCLCRALSRVPFGRLSLYTVVCLSYAFVEHYRGCHLADSLCTLLCVSPMPLSSIIEGAIWQTLFVHCCVSLLCLCRALSRVPFGRLSLYTVVCLSYAFVEHYRGCHLADSLCTLLCVSPMPLSSIIEGAIWQTLFVHCCVSLLCLCRALSRVPFGRLSLYTVVCLSYAFVEHYRGCHLADSLCTLLCVSPMPLSSIIEGAIWQTLFVHCCVCLLCLCRALSRVPFGRLSLYTVVCVSYAFVEHYRGCHLADSLCTLLCVSPMPLSSIIEGAIWQTLFVHCCVSLLCLCRALSRVPFGRLSLYTVVCLSYVFVEHYRGCHLADSLCTLLCVSPMSLSSIIEGAIWQTLFIHCCVSLLCLCRALSRVPFGRLSLYTVVCLSYAFVEHYRGCHLADSLCTLLCVSPMPLSSIIEGAIWQTLFVHCCVSLLCLCRALSRVPFGRLSLYTVVCLSYAFVEHYRGCHLADSLCTLLCVSPMSLSSIIEGAIWQTLFIHCCVSLPCLCRALSRVPFGRLSLYTVVCLSYAFVEHYRGCHLADSLYTLLCVSPMPLSSIIEGAIWQTLFIHCCVSLLCLCRALSRVPFGRLSLYTVVCLSYAFVEHYRGCHLADSLCTLLCVSPMPLSSIIEGVSWQTLFVHCCVSLLCLCRALSRVPFGRLSLYTVVCLSYAFVEHYRGCHLADSLYTLLCVSPMPLSSIIEGAIWQTLFIHCCVSLLCLCRALSRVPFGRLSLYTVVCLSYVFVEHYRGCHLADSLYTLLCVSPMPLSSIIEGAIWQTLFIHCCVSLLCLCRALSRVPFGRLSLYTVVCLSYAFVEHYRGCHLADSLYTLLCVSPMPLSSIIEGAIWQTLFIHCCVSLLCLCRALSRVPFGRLSLYTVVCLSYVFVEHYRGCHLADSLYTLLCVSPMSLSSIIEGAIWQTLFIHCCVSLLCLCRASSRVPFGRLSLYTVVCLSYAFVEHYRGCHLADSLYTLLCVSPMSLSSIIEGALSALCFS